MNLKQMEYILAIYRTGSFTEAAKRLYISQPSLSDQVKRLEEEYSVRIFERSRGKKLKVTEAGKIFVKYAIELTDIKNNLDNELKTYHNTIQSVIKVGIYLTFFYQPVSKLLKRFAQEYPDIKIQYTILTSNSLLKRLKDQKLDVIFITESPEADDIEKNWLVSDVILNNEINAILNIAHPLAKKDHLTWNDLDEEQILMVDRDSMVFPLVANKLIGIHPYIVGYSSQVDVTCQFVQNKLGIGFLMDNTFLNCSNQKNLVSIPIFPEVMLNICMVYKADSNSEIIKIFTKYIKDNLATRE